MDHNDAAKDDYYTSKADEVQRKAHELHNLNAMVDEVFGELPKSHTLMRVLMVINHQRTRIEDLEQGLEELKRYIHGAY